MYEFKDWEHAERQRRFSWPYNPEENIHLDMRRCLLVHSGL